jgi:hypothetical protein
VIDPIADAEPVAARGSVRPVDDARSASNYIVLVIAGAIGLFLIAPLVFLLVH